jgi:hypothetical protein
MTNSISVKYILLNVGIRVIQLIVVSLTVMVPFYKLFEFKSLSIFLTLFLLIFKIIGPLIWERGVVAFYEDDFYLASGNKDFIVFILNFP